MTATSMGNTGRCRGHLTQRCPQSPCLLRALLHPHPPSFPHLESIVGGRIWYSGI